MAVAWLSAILKACRQDFLLLQEKPADKMGGPTDASFHGHVQYVYEHMRVALRRLTKDKWNRVWNGICFLSKQASVTICPSLKWDIEEDVRTIHVD